MNKTTNKVKKVPRFSVLDIVIVLLVVVAIVGVYFRYNIIDIVTNAMDIKEYTVSYTIENIRAETPKKYVNIGDKMYFADSGDEFGTLIAASENVVALSSDIASETFVTADGKVVTSPYPMDKRVMATGRLNCEGKYSSDGRFLVNGLTHITMGQYVDVKTEMVTVTIRIDNIALVAE